MNLSYYISKRFGRESKGSFSRVVSTIAVISIAVALAILIGAFLILGGFKKNIKDKVYSFDAHIQVYDLASRSLDNGNQMESSPVSDSFYLYRNPNVIQGVKSINIFTSKVGMIMRNDEVHSAVLKGLGEDYDANEFSKYIVEGEFLKLSANDTIKDVVVSEAMKNKLRLEVGESFKVSFLRFTKDSSRFVHKRRKFNVVGIFKTNLPEIDEKLILCDHKQIRWVNGWEADEVGGFEVTVSDVDKLDSVMIDVQNYARSYRGNKQVMEAKTIREKYFPIFSWLDLLNMNVKVLIIIVFSIACLNIFSTLFILVTERTNTIGILKALGATDLQISGVFWVKGMSLLLKGIVIGNVIGLGFCAAQHYLEIIPLDPANYYMDTVPIEWNWPIILALNVFVLVFVNVVLFVPILFIMGVKPIKAIRFS